MLEKELAHLESLHTALLQGIDKDTVFADLASQLYSFHRMYNKLYDQWCTHIGAPAFIEDWHNIPCIPISCFKSHKLSIYDRHEMVFESSRTTGQIPSRHYIYRMEHYIKSFMSGWNEAFGAPQDIAILGLLPSYLERDSSSLVYMVNHLIKESRYEESGFFLNDHAALYDVLQDLKQRDVPTVLIGVSFGLLDFIENYTLDFPELILIETGGMKGRRKEIVREELHELLCSGFAVKKVFSEYGMTELLSQAYTQGGDRFYPSKTMDVCLRHVDDPLMHYVTPRRTGLLNIIDLSNLTSCPFIATDDLGRMYEDGGFSVLGRLDHADIRGCNLLIS